MVALWKFILDLFLGLLGVPRTLHFGGLNIYFFARKTVKSEENPRDGVLFLPEFPGTVYKFDKDKIKENLDNVSARAFIQFLPKFGPKLIF